jgi:hypothetical protein
MATACRVGLDSFGTRVFACLLTLFISVAPLTALAQRHPGDTNAERGVDARPAATGFVSEPRFLSRAIDIGLRTIGDGEGMKKPTSQQPEERMPWRHAP